MNEQIVDRIVNQWGSKEYKGRGRLTIPSYFDTRGIILRTLQRIYQKATPKVYIIVKGFNDRTSLTTYLTNQEDTDNNDEFKNLIRNKNLVIVTENLFNDMNYMFRDKYIITYNLENYEENTLKRIEDSVFIFDINSEVPKEQVVSNLNPINCVTAKDLDDLRLATPVEETQVGVHIATDSKEYEELQELDSRITKALNIFTDFDTINKARNGDIEHNLSANDVCINIATENGWTDHLDMSLPYNQKLDEIYNPNELAELAYNTYDFIRERKQLLSSYYGKIDKIKEIIGGIENVDKLIIICKKSDFVIQVATELNRVFGENFCRPICDKLEPIPAIDFNGNPIYYKSGKQKGKRKTLGAIAQQTLYNQWYNANKIKCLVLGNAPSTKLTGNVRTIIITSPNCMTIEEYMYRLPYIIYDNGKIDLYSLFCVDTQEQKQILRVKETKFHKIVKNTEQVDDNGNFVPKIFVD